MSVCIIIAILLLALGCAGGSAKGAEAARSLAFISWACSLAICALVFGLLVLERGWP